MHGTACKQQPSDSTFQVGQLMQLYRAIAQEFPLGTHSFATSCVLVLFTDCGWSTVGTCTGLVDCCSLYSYVAIFVQVSYALCLFVGYYKVRSKGTNVIHLVSLCLCLSGRLSLPRSSFRALIVPFYCPFMY
jgi:hypothetical protein